MRYQLGQTEPRQPVSITQMGLVSAAGGALGGAIGHIIGAHLGPTARKTSPHVGHMVIGGLVTLVGLGVVVAIRRQTVI